MPSISSKVVEVDEHVTGNHWIVEDSSKLVNTIALIALGQAEYASEIINELSGVTPVKSIAEYYNEARHQLKITGTTDEQKLASQHHRDGFLFECISWIASQQESDENTYLKDPHISSTTQGLDGLILKMDPQSKSVLHITICEDKCTQNPRRMFKRNVLSSFSEHHEGKRGRDLLANAVALIKLSGLRGKAATEAATKIHDNKYRSYRAALTVPSSISTNAKRKKLFKDYNQLSDINQSQRIGVIFTVDKNLREWFQLLSEQVIVQLNKFEAEDKR